MTTTSIAQWTGLTFVAASTFARWTQCRVRDMLRDMFTEPELFDLEMELIFEKNWIYACHEGDRPIP